MRPGLKRKSADQDAFDNPLGDKLKTCKAPSSPPGAVETTAPPSPAPALKTSPSSPAGSPPRQISQVTTSVDQNRKLILTDGSSPTYNLQLISPVPPSGRFRGQVQEEAASILFGPTQFPLIPFSELTCDELRLRFVIRKTYEGSFELVLGNEGRPDRGCRINPSHRSVVGYNECFSAGNLHVRLDAESGTYKITKISNKSGDYNPHPDTLYVLLHILQKKSGVDLDDHIVLELYTASSTCLNETYIINALTNMDVDQIPDPKSNTADSCQSDFSRFYEVSKQQLKSTSNQVTVNLLDGDVSNFTNPKFASNVRCIFKKVLAQKEPLGTLSPEQAASSTQLPTLALTAAAHAPSSGRTSQLFRRMSTSEELPSASSNNEFNKLKT